MRLHEITDDNEDPHEIRVMQQTFPEQWKRMLRKLIDNKSQSLLFCGLPIYGPKGFGEAVLRADRHMKKAALDGHVSVDVPVNENGNVEVEVKELTLHQVLYCWGHQHPNRLIMVYEGVADEDSFDDALVNALIDDFGSFDPDNPYHATVYTHNLSRFRRQHNRLAYIFAAGNQGDVELSSTVTYATGAGALSHVLQFTNFLIDGGHAVLL